MPLVVDCAAEAVVVLVVVIPAVTVVVFVVERMVLLVFVHGGGIAVVVVVNVDDVAVNVVVVPGMVGGFVLNNVPRCPAGVPVTKMAYDTRRC